MFFLFIFIILLILAIAIYTSRLEIEIHNLKIDTEKSKGEKINKDSKIFVYILIFKKFKILKKDRKNMKLQNRDLDIKLLKNKDIEIDYSELLKSINIKKVDLNIQIGTEDAALTAVLTGLVGAAIGVILRKPKYEIIPVFSNKNFLKIKLNCIISINLTQYIYKLISSKLKDLGNKSLNKKVEVWYEWASNRKSYDDCND